MFNKLFFKCKINYDFIPILKPQIINYRKLQILVKYHRHYEALENIISMQM